MGDVEVAGNEARDKIISNMRQTINQLKHQQLRVDPFHAMPPVNCRGWAKRTAGREMCPADSVCVESVQRFAEAKRHSPPRVAVLLRGAAYRNLWERTTEGSCCRGTEASQRTVLESWETNLFAPLEQLGYEINIYVATYHCSNGKPWVQRDLLPLLAARLRGVYIGAGANTTQTTTRARVLELAAAESSSREDTPAEFVGRTPNDRAFEHVFILRLDMAITRSNMTCLFDADGPMMKEKNPDQFEYFPGRFFGCAVRARFSLGKYGHTTMAKTLSLAGVNVPRRDKPVLYPHSPGRPGRKQESCGWSHSKKSATDTARALEQAGRKDDAERMLAECYFPRTKSREFTSRDKGRQRKKRKKRESRR